MKLAIPILVLFLALGIYFGIRPNSKSSKLEIAVKPISRASVPSQREASSKTKPVTRAQENLATNVNSGREEIESRIQSLIEASSKSDPDSLRLITTALCDPSVEVRQAAVDAAIQVGSRDAIPFLKEAAEQTIDPHEKVEILDAMKFLELPSFSEIKQTRRTNTLVKP